MTRPTPHRRLSMAVSLATGLAALLLVLALPASGLLAMDSGASKAHACCESHDADTSTQAQPAAHDCPMADRLQLPEQSCSCHLMPDDDRSPGDAVAVTGATFSFGTPVAAHTNPQIDLPLAREPDPAASTTHLGFEPASPPLYLLNSTMLL